MRLFEIDLYGTPTPQPVKWAVGNGNWDTNTLNWKSLNGGNTVSYIEKQSRHPSMTAPPAAVPITVTLTGNRSPTILTNNSTKNYVLTGKFQYYRWTSGQGWQQRVVDGITAGSMDFQMS